MTQIAYAYRERTTATTTTNTTYTDIENAALSNASFTAGSKYLIVATAQMKSSANTQSVAFRLVHGSTEFAGSEHHFEPDDANAQHMYGFFTVWTAVSTEDVKMQMRAETSNTASADQACLFQMKIDTLTENTDWFFNEDTTGDTVSATGWDTLASVAFTPSGVSDWLVMMSARQVADAANRSVLSKIARRGEATSDLPQVSMEGRATGGPSANGIYLQTQARAFALTAVENRFRQDSRGNSASSAFTRSRSAVFALNMNKFAQHASTFTEGTTSLLTANYSRNVQTMSLTPSTAGNYFVLGQSTADITVRTEWHKVRMQIDNVDQPPTQTSASAVLHSGIDATDEYMCNILTVENLSAAAHLLDMDASAETQSPWMRDRSIIAFSLELAANGGPTTSPKMEPMLIVRKW